MQDSVYYTKLVHGLMKQLTTTAALTLFAFSSLEAPFSAAAAAAPPPSPASATPTSLQTQPNSVELATIEPSETVTPPQAVPAQEFSAPSGGEQPDARPLDSGSDSGTEPSAQPLPDRATAPGAISTQQARMARRQQIIDQRLAELVAQEREQKAVELRDNLMAAALHYATIGEFDQARQAAQHVALEEAVQAELLAKIADIEAEATALQPATQPQEEAAPTATVAPLPMPIAANWPSSLRLEPLPTGLNPVCLPQSLPAPVLQEAEPERAKTNAPTLGIGQQPGVEGSAARLAGAGLIAANQAAAKAIAILPPPPAIGSPLQFASCGGIGGPDGDMGGGTVNMASLPLFSWPMAAADLTFPLPIPAAITSIFGWRIHPISGDRRFHQGIDFGAPSGTPVLAANSGQVATADYLGGYGLTVIVENNPVQQRHLYAHLSGIVVRPGTAVARGQVIGWVGSTGNSTGPHLHFEVHAYTDNGWVAINPMPESGPEPGPLPEVRVARQILRP